MQLNHYTGVPRATGMFPWGSVPAKRLKTTGVVEQVQCAGYGYGLKLSHERNVGGEAAFFLFTCDCCCRWLASNESA